MVNFWPGQCPAQLLVAQTTVALTVTLDADLDSIDHDRVAFERKFEVRAATCALESFCALSIQTKRTRDANHLNHAGVF
jgi:hypothetical protein